MELTGPQGVRPLWKEYQWVTVQAASISAALWSVAQTGGDSQLWSAAPAVHSSFILN